MPMKDGKPIPYQDGGGARKPTNAEVVEAVFIRADPEEPKDSASRKWAKGVVARATSKQKKSAHKKLDSADPEMDKGSKKEAPPPRGIMPEFLRKFEKGRSSTQPAEDRNMGGLIIDELGYENGGMSYSDRGPIKYSKGGAVKGKNFKGSF